MAGIREFIAQELGFDTNNHYAMANVNTLIEGYSRSHDGYVNPNEIVNDVKATANHIIDNVANAASGYNFRHEVIECGKDRQEDAIMMFGGSGAHECLPDGYADSIGNWSSAIYEAAGNLFEERAFGNGIEGYRDFVNNTPYHNIDAVAHALGKETETAKFIVENGNEKDFHNLMMDIRPNANDPEAMEGAVWTDYSYPSDPLDSGNNGTTVHGCPRELSDRIFDAAKTLEAGGGMEHFSRDGIMSGLKGINREKDMTAEEKTAVQDAYMSGHLENTVPYGFENAISAESDDKFEMLSNLLTLEHDAKDTAMERIAPLTEDLESRADHITPEEFTSSVQSAFQDVFEKDGLDVVQIEMNEDRGTLTVVSDIDENTGRNHYIDIPAGSMIQAMDTVNKIYEDAAKDRIESIRENGAEDMDVEKHVTDIYSYSFFEGLTKDAVNTDYTIRSDNDETVYVRSHSDENRDKADSRYIETERTEITDYMSAYDLPESVRLTESEWNDIAGKLDSASGNETHDTVINDKTYDMDLSHLNDDELAAVRGLIGYDDAPAETTELFVSAVSGKGFDSDQCRELRYIVDIGLSDEEVMFIANPDYGHDLMHELSEDFSNGISIENTWLYLDNDLSKTQRGVVKDAIREGMSPEDIRTFSSGDYDANQMRDIMNSIEKGADSGRIGTYISPDEDRQVNSVILSGLESGLTDREMGMMISEFTNSEYPTFDRIPKMEAVRNGFNEGVTDEQMENIIGRGYNSDQITVICKAYEAGMDESDIERFADPRFDSYCMEAISEAIQSGKPEEQIDLMTSAYFTVGTMSCITLGFKDGLPMEDVKLIANPDFELDQADEVLRGFDDGLSIDQVSVYADSAYDNKQMKEIRTGFEEGLSMDQVMIYAKPENDDWKMSQIRDDIENRVPMNILEIYSGSEFDANQTYEIRNAFRNDMPMEQILFFAKNDLTDEQMHFIKVGFAEGITTEQMEPYINDGFDGYQMREIFAGIHEGIDDDRISLYADHDFSADYYSEKGNQMHEIRLGIENGLTEEQISVYADSRLAADDNGGRNMLSTGNQMHEIRIGLENGISMEQASVLADSGLSANPESRRGNQMEQVRLGFEHGLSVDEMQDLISPGMDAYDIRVSRIDRELEPHVEELKENGINIDDYNGYYERNLKELIADGIAEGMDVKEIAVYAHPDLKEKEMKTLKDFAATETGQAFADRGISDEESKALLSAINAGMSKEQIMTRIEVHTGNNFDGAQERELDSAIKAGMNAEDAQFLADLDLPGIYEPDMADYLINGELTENQMSEAAYGLLNGLSHEDVEIYAKKEYTDSAMTCIREALEAGKGPDAVRAVIEDDSVKNQTVFHLMERLQELPGETETIEKDTPSKLYDGRAVSITLTGSFDTGYEVKMHPVDADGNIMKNIDLDVKGRTEFKIREDADNYIDRAISGMTDGADSYEYSRAYDKAMEENGLSDSDIYKGDMENLNKEREDSDGREKDVDNGEKIEEDTVDEEEDGNRDETDNDNREDRADRD